MKLSIMIWVCCLMPLTLMVFPGCVVFDFKEGALQEPDGMVKITNKRIPMDASVMALCFYRPELWSPHTMAEADIYVNRTVIDYRRKNPGSFAYPIGSRFVKKKFSKGKIQENPDEIGTVMVKKADTGQVTDWKFSFIRHKDGTFLELRTPAGRLSCSKCHRRYKSRGYISWESESALKAYLGERQ
jgi:hypothetical protein|tara:strand:- start:433 stop:990 length:558 start_codon:yes stop_codon:yes gene_type:complete